ncbi:MAG: PEP-CTERM sorting domain-containing protein [Phycisphaerales bacterium]
MKIAITAIAAIAGAATASPYFTAANGYQSVASAPAGAALATVTIDISGIETWDEEGSAFNTVIGANLAANAHVVGIGWDTNQIAGLDSGGASWLSEMTITFGDSAGPAVLFLTPSGTGAPGTESNSSGGIFDLTVSALDFFVGADGVLSMEFFESFVDQAGAAEGLFDQGSQLQIQYVVPAPGALAMLGLGGLVAGRRRR